MVFFSGGESCTTQKRRTKRAQMKWEVKSAEQISKTSLRKERKAAMLRHRF
jgi:hypothetical protein